MECRGGPNPPWLLSILLWDAILRNRTLGTTILSVRTPGSTILSVKMPETMILR